MKKTEDIKEILINYFNKNLDKLSSLRRTINNAHQIDYYSNLFLNLSQPSKIDQLTQIYIARQAHDLFDENVKKGKNIETERDNFVQKYYSNYGYTDILPTYSLINSLEEQYNLENNKKIKKELNLVIECFKTKVGQGKFFDGIPVETPDMTTNLWRLRNSKNIINTNSERSH